MAGSPAAQPEGQQKEQLLKCVVCDSYFHKQETFYCPKCKRSPLCKKHRVRGRRECVSCFLAILSKELTALKEQEYNLKSFLRFVHFLFLVFAIFFVAYKLNLAQQVEFLDNDFIADNLIYLGIAICAGYVFFFFILYGQKKRIETLEAQISKERRLVV